MRIVHHHDAARVLGEVAQRRQWPQIAVHAEHAVGDEELALGGGQILDDLASRIHVLVREDLDRRAAQAAAVDDAGVVQLVGNDDIFLRQDCRDRACIRGESTLKDDDLLDLLELGETALQLHVDFHRSGDGADRARADAEPFDGLERGLPQARMRRQTEIVVRRQIDHGLVVDGRMRLLLVVENAELAEELLLAQRVEFLPQISQRISAHSRPV
jgi:hypothetical protein